MHYVFLNPDGTGTLGLGVIVHANTGVVYANQCDGLANDIRSVEGFFIPLASRAWLLDEEEALDVEASLMKFFNVEFRGNPYLREMWTEKVVNRLGEIVARVPIWRTTPEGQDERMHLALDMSRVNEATEAWVPVTTPYGPGILVFDNCD